MARKAVKKVTKRKTVRKAARKTTKRSMARRKPAKRMGRMPSQKEFGALFLLIAVIFTLIEGFDNMSMMTLGLGILGLLLWAGK